MVEGLTTSAPGQGSGTGSGSDSMTTDEIDDLDFNRSPRSHGAPRLPPITFSSKILVTLAERPYPFPSRTRKSSSPAPKILRGQPFGNIGRRQDFCVSGPAIARTAAMPGIDR